MQHKGCIPTDSSAGICQNQETWLVRQNTSKLAPILYLIRRSRLTSKCGGEPENFLGGS